jgi:lysophospholipase L1-like esterase
VARSAVALNSANWFARMRRHRQFLNRIGGGYSGPVIVAEGDSWWQYPLRLKDAIDHLMEPFAIRCLSAAGDLLGDMADKAEYLPALRETNASILLMSGGGNDLLRGGQLANHLETYHPELKPADYLKPSFERVLELAFSNYERILRDVHGAFPQVHVLVHGYDYAIPNKGRWLGRPMERCQINDRALQAKIAEDMMDRFNRGLRRLVANLPHVTYVDVRNTVGAGRWYDELHPTDDGYGAVAAKFEREIRQLDSRRGGVPIYAPGGAFGQASDLRRRAAATAAAPTESVSRERMMSLHVGLNLLDPAHYAGWDGALSGCENDATAMERLARGQGFETRLLLTEAATRSAVIAAITEAAEVLQPGEMFLFTMAGHGGRIPDWNGDELDDGTGTAMDETLCLFDSQLVDDELYLLWSRFREGVRILMVGDTCHSGMPIRFNPLAPPLPDALTADPTMRPRCMPLSVETRTWRQNREEYRDRATAYAGIEERVLLNPLDMVVKAEVMGLGACQDNQYAMDGPEHGAFTAALLRVWDQGRYRGDYHDIRHRVEREIASPMQIPNLDTQLLRDPGFARQQPFTLWPKAPDEPSAARPT